MRWLPVTVVSAILASGAAFSFDGGVSRKFPPPTPANLTCAQSTTFLARTTGLNTAHQTAYGNVICHLVNDNIITGNLTGATGGCGTLLDALYLMATQTAVAGALNLCGTSYSLVPTGAPAFTVDGGWTGVEGSTTVFLNTQFQPSSATAPNYVLNSAHISDWSLTNNVQAAGTNDIPIGSYYSGVHNTTITPNATTSGNNFMVLMNTGALVQTTPTGSNKGWFVAANNATTAFAYFNNTLNGSGASTPTQIPVSVIFILASSSGGSTISLSGIPQMIGMASIGANLTGAQVTAMYNDICNYWLMPIHGSC